MGRGDRKRGSRGRPGRSSRPKGTAIRLMISISLLRNAELNNSHASVCLPGGWRVSSFVPHGGNVLVKSRENGANLFKGRRCLSLECTKLL